MPSILDISGQKYGRLTALEYVGKNDKGRTVWRCRCDCGATLLVTSNSLRRNNTRSCGCFKRDQTVAAHRTHGMCRSSEYRTWCMMRDRCSNPENKNWKDYGGRGIRVCDRWQDSFENFLADMGRKLCGLNTIEREDTNGNYEPGNCRWASQKEQTRNKRSSHLLTYKGETLCLGEWAEKLGVNARPLWARVRRGWTPEQVIETPFTGRWWNTKRGSRCIAQNN